MENLIEIAIKITKLNQKQIAERPYRWRLEAAADESTKARAASRGAATENAEQLLAANVGVPTFTINPAYLPPEHRPKKPKTAAERQKEANKARFDGLYR